VSVALVLAFAGSIARCEDAAGEDHLAPLSRFIGNWVIDAKWVDGNDLHARASYEWGLGKKIIKYKVWVGQGVDEYLRYEGVIAYHPMRKQIVEYSFAFDGGITEVVLDVKDADTVQTGFTAFDPANPPKVRQVLKFTGNDKHAWTVEVSADGQWQQIMDGVWKRQ